MSHTTLRGSIPSFCLAENSPLSGETHCGKVIFSENTLGLELTYVEIQKKTFTKWINSQLAVKEDHIISLEADLKDGERLLKLLESLSKQTLPKVDELSTYNQQQSNVETALRFLENTLGEPLSTFNSEDIVDGNISLILELIWLLILQFQIRHIDQDICLSHSRPNLRNYGEFIEKREREDQLSNNIDVKASLLIWVQNQFTIYGESAPLVEDFHQSWKNGAAFSALINRHDPRLIAHPESMQVRVEKGQEEWGRILSEAFLIANKSMGIPILLDTEDLLYVKLPDERSIMTYVSEFYTVLTRKQKDEESRQVIEAVRKEIDTDRNQKKLELQVKEALAVGTRLVKEIQKSLNTLPVVTDLETELDQLTLGGYWASLTSLEQTTTKLASDVHAFVVGLERLTIDSEVLSESSKCHLENTKNQVLAKYEDLCRESSGLNRACQDLQKIVDKKEEIRVFESAVNELSNDVHKLMTMRLTGTPRRVRSSLLSSINHDLDELEQSIVQIGNEMPILPPSYLLVAKEALVKAFMSAKSAITEENLQFEQDKSTEDFLSRLTEAIIKLEEGNAKITGVESDLLSCVFDFEKYKAALSEQKALLKSSSNSLKTIELELSALSLTASSMIEKGKSQQLDSNLIPGKMEVANGLTLAWQKQLQRFAQETQKFEELFKYLQIERLMRSKLSSIKSDIDSWDEDSAEHVVTQTGNGLRLLRKRFEDIALLYSKSIDFKFAQERHNTLEELLKESESLYEQKCEELGSKGTPTRWQDTAKDIENVLEKLRSTLSSRIVTHGLSCTEQQHDDLHREILQLDQAIAAFEKATWVPFELQTTERLGESSSGIRIIIENIHQVLLGSWIEVQESLERRKKEVGMISRGFEFRKLADGLETRMNDISLLTKKIVDQEELRNEAEVQLDTFKREIEHLSLEFDELFDSDDNIYVKRLAELEDTYESTRSYLVESLKENNSKVWWHQAEVAKRFISGLEEICHSVTSQFGQLTTKSLVDSYIQKVKDSTSNLQRFEGNELVLLANIKDSLDALPDEEKPEDMDKILSDFEVLQSDVSNINAKLRTSTILLSILLEVLPFEENLKILSAQLDARSEEVQQLISETKWAPGFHDISPLQKRYETLCRQITDIKQESLIPHSKSISLVVNLLQSHSHPRLAEKKKYILGKRDEILSQYNNLGSAMEQVKLLTKRIASIISVMALVEDMEVRVLGVKDKLNRTSALLDNETEAIAAQFQALEFDLEALGNKVRAIPEISALLGGGNTSDSGLEAAILRYENLAQSIHSTSKEFSQKRDIMHRNRLRDEYMATYTKLITWIRKEKQGLDAEGKLDDINALEIRYDSIILLKKEILMREATYGSLNALCSKYKESNKDSDATNEFQTMLSCSEEVNEAWNYLKELTVSESIKWQSALMYARFVKATHNLFSVLDIIHQEIKSADPAMVANETVLKWREKLEEVEQDMSIAFAAACQYCTSEHTTFLQVEHKAAEETSNRIKTELAKFLSGIKSSRLLTVYLDDSRDFNSTLVNRNQEIADSRCAHNVISGDSLEDDESQLGCYIDIYSNLEPDFRTYTTRYDNLREYYFTLLAQSSGISERIGQMQEQIEFEWTRMSGMYNGMKKEAELLQLHVQWHQQLRITEQVLDSAERRLSQLDNAASIELQKEVQDLEKMHDKCRANLGFAEHPHWSSLSKNPHHNILVLQRRYSAVQARLNKLGLAPYNLRNTYANGILESLHWQIDHLQLKIDNRGKNPSVSIYDVIEEAESVVSGSIMEKLRILDDLFTTSSDLDEKHQNQRKNIEIRAKTLFTTLEELQSRSEHVQEFRKLMNRIDNALGTSLDLIEQTPLEEEAVASVLKQLESSFSSLTNQIPQEIEKANSLAEGLDDWDVQERLRILPEQWEEMKLLITRRLQELSELGRRKSQRSSLISAPIRKRLLPRSRSMSPHITWRFKLEDPRSTWRPTSPITGSYMRPTLASLSKISAANPSLKSLRRPLGNSPSSSPLPSLGQLKGNLQVFIDANPSSLHSTPEKVPPTSPNAYIPDPKDPLDVELGRVINSCPVSIKVIKANENGHYWIGEIYPKLCYCRLLISKMVMVRVGGGWAELSRYLAEHYSFERRFVAISNEWASSQKGADIQSSSQETMPNTPDSATVDGGVLAPDTETVPYFEVPIDK